MRDDWTETTLGEVAIWGSGGTPKSGESAYYDGDIPWCVIGDLTEGEVLLTEKCITSEGLKNSSAKIVEPGAVMIAMYGASIGRTGIVGRPMATNQAIAFAYPSVGTLDNRFLLSFLQTRKSQFVEAGQGAAQPNISQTVLKAWPIILPPLAEQKRIVDVVSSVETYIEALQQQVVTARTARNAVLHQLFSTGGDDWTGTTLGEISELVSRGRAPSYCDDDGVVVLNQKCVRYGRIFFEFARRTDSTKKTIPEWAYLKVGDTLINSTGVGTLGRASFVSCLDGPTTFDSHVTLVRPRHDSSFPQFIGMTLNFLENEIGMFASGSTGQTELSREAVNSFPISLPPLEEQKRIVEIVSSMDELIQSTEQAVTDAKNLRSGLLSDLLSGEHEIPASYDSSLGAA